MLKCKGQVKNTETMLVISAVGSILIKTVLNICDLVMQKKFKVEFYFSGYLQSIVIDGINMRCPCCGVHNCDNNLESICDCFFLEHHRLNLECAVTSWTKDLDTTVKRTGVLQLHENFTKSSLCSIYYHLPLLFSLCLLALAPGFSLLAYPAKTSALYLHSLLTLPTPLTSLSLSVCNAPLAHLCSSSSVWPQLFLLSGSLLPGSLFWPPFWPLVLPGSSCFSLAPLSGLVSLAPSDQRWEMLRNVGKSGWARKMREVEGWAAMDYPSVCLTTPSQAYLVPIPM